MVRIFVLLLDLTEYNCYLLMAKTEYLAEAVIKDRHGSFTRYHSFAICCGKSWQDYIFIFKKTRQDSSKESF